MVSGEEKPPTSWGKCRRSSAPPQAGEGVGWAGRWRGAAGRREEGSCVYTQGRGRGWGAKPGERPSREKAAIVHAGQLHGGPEASSQEESKSFLLRAGRRAKEKEEERLRRRDWGRGGEKRERRKEHRRDGGGSGALPVLDRIQIHPLILQPFNEQLLRGRPPSSAGILGGQTTYLCFHGADMLDGRQPTRHVAKCIISGERAREADEAGTRAGRSRAGRRCNLTREVGQTTFKYTLCGNKGSDLKKQGEGKKGEGKPPSDG